MSVTVSDKKEIILKLFQGEDYRIVVFKKINEIFLEFVIGFFKKIVDAKMGDKSINIDWYKKAFLSDNLKKDEIAINSGLNMKMVNNMCNSSKREVVLDLSKKAIEEIYALVNNLVKDDGEIDLRLTIKFKGVAVELNVSESLIVINTIAVKRSALRGGIWSEAGKGIERPLMETLCRLYSVPEQYYYYQNKQKSVSATDREADFHIKSRDGQEYNCEVKLMGKGNPESADGAFARDAHIFIADKLSPRVKDIADARKIEWVELRSDEGFRKFEQILKNLNVPYSPPTGDINKRIEEILSNALGS